MQMEEGYELDLTYVTERIIAVSFPQDCFEETYLRNLRDVTRMLKSKHTDNYLVRIRYAFTQETRSLMCFCHHIMHHGFKKLTLFNSSSFDFQVINLSERKQELTKMNPKVLWRICFIRAATEQVWNMLPVFI